MAAEGEPLREVRGDAALGSLLRVLREDMPQSVHVVNRIETLEGWRRRGLLEDGVGLSHTLYRYVGDEDAADGAATVVSLMRLKGFPMIALHTTDPACTALRLVLRDSAFLPWDEGEVLYESVHERCIPDLVAEVRRRGDPSPATWPTDKMFLSRDEALKLDVSPPPGLRLRPLQPRHVPVVAFHWGARMGPGLSEDWLLASITREPNLSWGVFLEDDPDGDPVAFVMTQTFGGLGSLHTLDSHRRQGLGVLVARAASRALAERGLDVHSNIEYPNPASAATHAKLGMRRVCECAWVQFDPDKSKSAGGGAAAAPTAGPGEQPGGAEA